MFLCSCITFGSCFLDIMESGSFNMYRDGTGEKMAAALAPVQNHVFNEIGLNKHFPTDSLI